jgi:hypothetical protein
MILPAPQSEASITPKTYTLYQGKFLAHQLILEGTAEESAKVDTNRHQVEPALFALQSPLSQGAILADEVRLGKTIEASLVIAQRWAEKKRKILTDCSSNPAQAMVTGALGEVSSANRDIGSQNL